MSHPSPIHAVPPLEQPATPGILLPCPACGDAEARISLDLDDMTTCFCHSCEENFDIADVRSLIAKWTRVLDWISTAPTTE